jgi:septal ring factor EnvC (AmiA/AmiB activator)
MTNPTIETDIAEILKDLQSGQKEILKEISEIKVGLEKVNEDIKVLDTKVEQLALRVGNQEFTPIRVQANRGVLIGLILALLGGAIKIFGLMPNP